MGGVKTQHLGVVKIYHAPHVAFQFGAAGVDCPRIAVGDNAKGIIVKEAQPVAFFVAQRHEGGKAVVTLAQPVAMFVRRECFPALAFGQGVDGGDAAEGGDFLQFFFAAQIVANVVVIDFAAFFGVGVFDKKGNGDARHAAAAEDVFAFLGTPLAEHVFADVAAKVEDVDAGEFVGKAAPQAVHRRFFKKAAVGDEADDAAALVVEPVGCPAQGTHVAVIQPFGKRCVGARGIGFGNASVQRGIFQIFVVVAFAFLPDGIWRIAHDDADGEFFLAAAAVGVVDGEELELGVGGVGFVELEGVGKGDAAKGLVVGGGAAAGDGVVGSLNVDGGDVVGKEDDFVGKDAAAVFGGKLRGRDEARLEQAGDEGAGAGEGVEDADVVVAEGFAKFALEEVGDAGEDEVNDFHRGVDDAKALRHAGEGAAEEFVVQLDDDFLFAGKGADVFDACLDGFVEAGEVVRVFVRVFAR